jgi:hypothetical protein
MDSGTVAQVYALAVSAFFGLRAVRNIVKGRESNGCRVVKGEVLESFVRNRLGRYIPVVRYKYASGDHELRGSRIAYVNPYLLVSSKVAADAVAKQFQKGSQVNLRVDPRHPKESVLRPGSRVQNWIEAIAAVVFGILVAVM